MRSSRFVAALAFVLSVSPLIAGEGRISIPFQAPVTFPISITAPGKYVLTRDLVGPGGVAVIEIDAPDVEIDLNGKVISNGFPGIRIELLAEAVIRNGAIESGGIGIHGVTGLNDVVIEDVHISDVSAQGILLNDPDTYVIRRCIIEDLGGLLLGQGAIDIANGANSQGTIESNVIRRTSQHAIVIDSGSGIVIRDNRIREILSLGILVVGEAVEGVLISENTLQGCGVGGIFFFADGSKLINNLVVDSSGDGIHIGGHDNLILDNVVRGSSDSSSSTRRATTSTGTC